MNRTLFPLSAYLVVAIAVAACGGSDTPSGSTEGPGDKQPTNGLAADLAVDGAVTRVEFGQAWLGAASTPGKCEGHQVASTYDRATHEATWHVCQEGAFVDSSRALTQDEAARVEASLAVITYVNNPPCAGYDGLSIAMTTFHADGSSQRYVKENINCYDFPAAPKLGDTFGLLLAMK